VTGCDQMAETCDLKSRMFPKCKVVFLGASGVGKTSLINRYILNDFDKDYSATVGIDFFTKPIQVRDRTVNLQIWDTAGQERFRSLIPFYIRDSSMAVIVYDVSNPETFEAAKSWHKTVINERGSDVVCILVGNENDLESKVSPETVATFCKPLAIATIETCAKTGQNVARLFKLVSESLPDPDATKVDPISVIAGPAEQTPNDERCLC
jgi:Ras-related protein Rab-6A